MGDREVERRVRACADRLDAAAAVERCRSAEGERRVSIRPVPDAWRSCRPCCRWRRQSLCTPV
jgi:hypothetical protein